MPEVVGQIAIVVISQAPFLLLAGWQAIRMARQPVLTRRDVFLLLFLGFSVLPFFLGRHYFPHYMVQAIPAVVVLATEALSQAAVAPAGRLQAFFFRHARTFILVNVALFSLINTAYYSLVLHDGPNPALARFIQQHTNPDDSVFLWTWRSHVLFEVDRVYATRFLSNEFLTGRLYGLPASATGSPEWSRQCKASGSSGHCSCGTSERKSPVWSLMTPGWIELHARPLSGAVRVRS